MNRLQRILTDMVGYLLVGAWVLLMIMLPTWGVIMIVKSIITFIGG